MEVTVPDANKKVEVSRPKAGLDRVEIIDQAGEESEEWLLLELRPLFLMKVGQNKHKDGQNLRQVMDLHLLVVTRSITMILDHEDDQSGHSV